MSLGLTFVSKLQAQSRSTTASLTGTITDPSGAVVPKATVKITNPDNGTSREATTGATGDYSFALLLPGDYILEASAPGFKTTKQTGIVLTPGDSLNLTVRLTIGTTEQVAVNASGPLPRPRPSAPSSRTSKSRNFRSISGMCSALRHWILL